MSGVRASEADVAVREAAVAAQALADRLADRNAAPEASLPAGAEPAKARDAAKPVARAPSRSLRSNRSTPAARASSLAASAGSRSVSRRSWASERSRSRRFGRKPLRWVTSSAELRDRVRNLSDRANYPAHEAASHVGEHAPQAMDQAVNHLAGGRAHAARDEERRAASVLGRGAELAEDVAAALRSEMVDAQGAIAQDGAGERGARRKRSATLATRCARLRRSWTRRGIPRGRTHAGRQQARQAMLRAARDLQAAAELTAAAPAPELAGLDDAGGEHADRGERRGASAFASCGNRSRPQERARRQG